MEDDKDKLFDFEPFYQYVIDDFTEIKDDENNELVGNLSDADSYIDANIETENKAKPVLPFLENWFEQKNYGVLLLHGEPGHGKTLLCKKAIYEYKVTESFLQSAPNVLWVSLNTGERAIIEGNIVNFENALSWGSIKKPIYRFEDCKGSLLFMDGFDELIDAAKQATIIKDINVFIKEVKEIAKQFKMHIVVLSRTIAVENDLSNPLIHDISYKLSSLSIDQQKDWFKTRPEYSDYYSYFMELCSDDNNKEIKRLLAIPLLFRMIVHNRFKEASTDTVDLYDKLFESLIKKRNLDIETTKERLMSYSYDIYCTDTDTAAVENNTDLILTFFFKYGDGERVGFYHRSFYQYFLAHYIYNELMKVASISDAKSFLIKLAERELDITIREYLRLLHKKQNADKIENAIDLSVNTLIVSEGILSFSRRIDNSNSDKSILKRSENIYRNLMHICNSLSYVIKVKVSDGLDRLIKVYNSSYIGFLCNENKKIQMESANLQQANLLGVQLKEANLQKCLLQGANLRRADLRKVDLRKANLSEANLIETILIEANLRKANLQNAILQGAFLQKAILNKADLQQANLQGAYLNKSNLIETNLTEANLKGANLKRANLRKASLHFSFLRGADLHRACLNNAHLYRADLQKAILCKANLNNAMMQEVGLQVANLEGATLIGANLTGSDLRWANLQNTNLQKADLSYSFLDDINEADKIASLSHAIIPLKYKSLFNPNTPGYQTVKWIKNY